MICTGTGAAPMRAMTERRRRLHRVRGSAERGADRQPDQDGEPGGRLLLFFGARTQQELPYFGPLMNLPRDFIDVNLALSRAPDAPHRYVQAAISERGDEIAALLRDERTHIYVCGVRGMEAGVLDALRAAAARHALHWESVHARLVRDGRLHLETY
jgi:sulfite reductase alpha subunit-like flavoprotein